MEDTNKYTLLLQNNASRKFYTYSGLTNTSTSHMYFRFEVELTGCPDGEYTYCLFPNNREDVEFLYKTPLQDTIVRIPDQDMLLRDLHPSIGLLRVGDKIPSTNIYDGSDNKIFYYDN